MREQESRFDTSGGPRRVGADLVAPLILLVLAVGILQSGRKRSDGLIDLIHDFPGVSVTRSGETILLEGQLDSYADFLRLRRLAAAIASTRVPVWNTVELSHAGKLALVQEINRRIAGTKVVARSIGNDIALEGTVDSDFEADAAVEIVRSLASDSMPDARSSTFLKISPYPARILDLTRVRSMPPEELPEEPLPGDLDQPPLEL